MCVCVCACVCSAYVQSPLPANSQVLIAGLCTRCTVVPLFDSKVSFFFFSHLFLEHFPSKTRERRDILSGRALAAKELQTHNQRHPSTNTQCHTPLARLRDTEVGC